MENRCECSKDTYHCRCWEEGKACCYCERVKQDQEREEREAQVMRSLREASVLIYGD